MGVSSLFGAIALIGFLLFLAGVGSVVVAASQGRPARSGVLLAVVGLVGGVLFSTISQGVVLVDATQRAVVFNTLTGNLDPTPLGPGTHIIVPFVNQVTYYSIVQQEYTMSGRVGEGAMQGEDAVEARTSDGQVVLLDITVIYRIDPAQVPKVHVDWQDRYPISFIRPTVRGLTRETVAQFSAEEIYGEQRTQLGVELESIVSNRLNSAGFELTDLLVRNVTFSDTFTAAIERKTEAEQDAQRAQILVRQQEQEAQRVRVQAEGQRDAAIARAQGEAQAIVLRAQAEAEALRLVSEQIAANPSLIQYQYIQSLADNINLALIPSNSPFLFDFNQLMEANPNFVAPAVPENSLQDFSQQATPEPTPEP